MATESQKRAQKAYYERTRGQYHTIGITLDTLQAEYDKETLKKNGKTNIKVWRSAVDSLPIQLTEEEKATIREAFEEKKAQKEQERITE